MLRLLCFLNLFVFSQLTNADTQTQSIQKNDGRQSVVPVVTVAPNYPLSAAQNQIEGYVELLFTITETGSVEGPKVIDSSPPEIFDEHAIKAILNYKFIPAREGGQPVRQEATQRIEFKIPDEYKKGHIKAATKSNDEKYVNYGIRYTTDKKASYFYHDLEIRNKANGQEIKNISLPASYKKAGLIIGSDGLRFAYYYYETKKRKAMIEVIDLKTLTKTHNIVTAQLTKNVVNNQTLSFYSLSEDGSHLLMQVDKGAGQKIINIDAETGQIINEFALGKTKVTVETTSDGQFLWVQPLQKYKNNKVRILSRNQLKQIHAIEIEGKLEKVYYYKNHRIIIENRTASKLPQIDNYFVKIFDTDDLKLFTGYESSVVPKVKVLSDQIYLIGKSVEPQQYLQVMNFDGDNFIDVSNTSIHMHVETVEAINTKDQQLFIVFGQKSVARFDISNPDQSVHVAAPFKLNAGIINNDNSKAYVRADSGARIGLIDFEKGQFMGHQSTGSKGKKVGQALFSVLVTAAAATKGYMVIPGIKLSNNALMLSKNQQWLYAINSKTDDLTVFRASDLGEKNIYKVGRNIIQIVQASHQENTPIVIIAGNQATFFDSETATIIKKVEYDHFIKISDDSNLVYQINNDQKHLALY